MKKIDIASQKEIALELMNFMNAYESLEKLQDPQANPDRPMIEVGSSEVVINKHRENSSSIYDFIKFLENKFPIQIERNHNSQRPPIFPVAIRADDSAQALATIRKELSWINSQIEQGGGYAAFENKVDAMLKTIHQELIAHPDPELIKRIANKLQSSAHKLSPAVLQEENTSIETPSPTIDKGTGDEVPKGKTQTWSIPPRGH